MISVWSKEDLAAHKMLDDLLSQKATWQLTTGDAVRLYRSLVWFAGLKDKIEKSQVEILGVRELVPPPAEET